MLGGGGGLRYRHTYIQTYMQCEVPPPARWRPPVCGNQVVGGGGGGELRYRHTHRNRLTCSDRWGTTPHHVGHGGEGGGGGHWDTDIHSETDKLTCNERYHRQPGEGHLCIVTTWGGGGTEIQTHIQKHTGGWDTDTYSETDRLTCSAVRGTSTPNPSPECNDQEGEWLRTETQTHIH